MPTMPTEVMINAPWKQMLHVNGQGTRQGTAQGGRVAGWPGGLVAGWQEANLRDGYRDHDRVGNKVGITRRARPGARLEAESVMQATCTLKHPNTEETESPVLQVDTFSMSTV